MEKKWNRKEITVDNIFAYNVAVDLLKEDKDYEPKSIEECRKKTDWPEWRNAIQAELNCLTKRAVLDL